jgi:hypothetical protein
MEISKDLGYRPVVFIRFNPDGYITKDNVKIPSSWGIDKTGICVVKPKQKTQWKHRLDSLCDQIRYWCKYENKMDKMIENVHLFYYGNM